MTTANPIPQIETIVWLMLENRSLDTMLGWLHPDGARSSWPPKTPLTFAGIPPGATNGYKHDAVGPTSGTRDLRVPHWNPYEWFEHVRVQMYGGAHGPPKHYDWTKTPPMSGFAYDFEYLLDRGHLQDVMGAYTREQLPVLYGLAESYAACDRWFSSVPSETDPNRAYSVCGTSLGAEDNHDPNASDPKGRRFVANTIFNAIEGKRSWGLYWQYDGLGAMDPGKVCYTYDVFPQIANAKGGEVEDYATFLGKLGSGELPEFCYLEPFWGGGTDAGFLQGNDYHPPAWVGPGEAALNDLFQRILASPQWPNMLFIVTFDEHGGTWDHVPPPPTVKPDGYRGKTGFTFERMGPRVPTILVSPFVDKGTVFRATEDDSADFDHTSFLATVCKWAGIDPKDAGLGARVAQAPTFEGVLRDVGRDDKPCFVVPEGYASQGKGAGNFTVIGIEIGDPMKLIEGLDIQTFRAIEKQSRDTPDFLARLQASQDHRHA